MADGELLAQLKTLFRETGAAHHQAFIETDGDDPEWPIWYAGQLRQPLNSLLGTSCTQSELVYLIVRVERERAEQAPETPWPDYYAKFFMKRYRGTQGTMPAMPGLLD